MNLEQIVQQILLMRHDLSREDVLKKIYEKKRSAEDYFLDEVAARIVASELGVEIQGGEEAFHADMDVKDLVSGLNDVTLVGRVIAVYPTQTFPRADLTEGKVARLLLSDKAGGTLTLVLWDDKVSMAKARKIKQGQIIRVLHGYVREGMDGKLELHLGKKGDVEASPSDIVESDYPQITALVDKIGELTPAKKRTNVLGVVMEVFSSSEFKRSDGTGGKVRRLRLKDDTGETTVVFWNEKVSELGEVKSDDQLRIINARVKTQPDGRIEVHVEKATQIEKLVSSVTPPTVSLSETTNKIAELKEGGPITVEGLLASTPNVREVTTAQKETVLVAAFDLADDTGKIRVSLWRKQAELGKTLSAGTRIRLKNVYAKRGFSNLLELVSRTSTTVEIVSKPEEGAQNKTE